MFNQRFIQPNQGINLNSQWKELKEILQKALGVSPQLWAANAHKETPDFLTLQQDAMQGPYGAILKQFNEGMVLLAILEQYQIAITDKIQETKRLIEELESGSSDLDDDEKSDSGKAPEEKKGELTESYNVLVVEQKKVNTVYRSLSNQLSLQLLRHIREIDHFIVNVAQKQVISQASKLGYHLNASERAIIETPVTRMDLEKMLKESYAKAKQAELDRQTNIAPSAPIDPSIPTAPAPPPAPEVARDFPKTEDFMARSLLDLEMRTFMALNAHLNRKVNEMIDPSTKSEPNSHEGAKSVTEAKNMAQEGQNAPTESAALQKVKEKVKEQFAQEDLASQNSNVENQNRPKPPRSRRDSRILYSVQDSMSLLKEFKSTFKNLEDRFNILNELHQQKTEEIYGKMRELIDNEKKNKKDIESSQKTAPTIGR